MFKKKVMLLDVYDRRRLMQGRSASTQNQVFAVRIRVLAPGLDDA